MRIIKSYKDTNYAKEISREEAIRWLEGGVYHDRGTVDTLLDLDHDSVVDTPYAVYQFKVEVNHEKAVAFARQERCASTSRQPRRWSLAFKICHSGGIFECIKEKDS